MRLSLSWIFVFIIITFIVFFTFYAWQAYEEFTMKETVEGFFGSRTVGSDIIITTCPQSEVDASQTMKAIVPKGSTETFCYDGTVKRCSLSADPENAESCTQYYLDLLNAKSFQCPGSMPNFFQNLSYQNNVDTSIRGCTSGVRKADGTAPVSLSDPYCYFYSKQKDDLENLDSCTNIKMLDSAQCFTSVTGVITKQLVAPQGGKGSPWVQCSITISGSPGAPSSGITVNYPTGGANSCSNVSG
jgi:hypothetical protein